MGKKELFSSLEDVNAAENQKEINKKIREQFEIERMDFFCTCMLYPPGYHNVTMRLQGENAQSTDSQRNIDIVACLQNKIEEINKELKKISDCKIVLVKCGSIIIHLLNYGPLLSRKSNIQRDVDNLLKVVFNHPAVAAFGCYNGLRFNVTLGMSMGNHIEWQHKSGNLKQEVLERNRNYLIEELSAVPFLFQKKADQIFTKAEIDSVLKGSSTMRESRMQALLSIISTKGDPAFRFFEMVLKEEKQTKIISRLRSSDRILNTSPTGSYEALIDEMSPSLIADQCKANGLDITRIVEKEKTLSRKEVCEKILEYALCQDDDTKQMFLWVFGKNYPDLVDFTTAPRVKMSSRSYEILETEENGWTQFYEGRLEIGRPDDDHMRETIQPDQLTTRVVSGTHFMKGKLNDFSQSNDSYASSGYSTDMETHYLSEK